MWQSREQLEPIQCPVCRALLGKRDKTQIFIAHCEECKTTFQWKPRLVTPTAILDSVLKHGCHCGRCGR